MNDAESWDACPPNLLTNLRQQRARQRLTRIAAATVGAVSLVALLGFGAWFWQLRQLEREFRYAGITCSEIRELLPEFRAKRLDERRSQMWRAHVARCSNCAEFRSELTDGQAARLASEERWLATAGYVLRPDARH